MGLDREQLKDATKGRARSRGGTGTAARETKAADALGTRKPLQLTWPDGTKAEFTVQGLDVNDLCDIEETYGSGEGFIAVVGEGRMTAIRFMLWLVLRKGDPRLTAEERNALRYRLTVQEAGALIAANPTSLHGLTQQILVASGFVQETGEGNAALPATESTGS